MRIAILEDDKDQSELLVAWLEEHEHSCYVYDNGAEFLQSFAKESFDLIILDWVVPQMSGIEVMQHIRTNSDVLVPILFVTSKSSEKDVVKALESGADDYMIKPIKQSEMVARFNALLRRSGLQQDENDQSNLNFDPYYVDTNRRSISLQGADVTMTQKEYDLMLFLFRNSGRVISRGHLLQVVWGTNPNINTRTVDTHISRLRNKLKIDPEITGWELTSIYQHGYRLEKVGLNS